MLDVLITGGKVVDGTGNPWFYGDVGIKDGLIQEISHLGDVSARTTIEAQGLVVAPGFIDMHSHSDLMLFVEPPSLPKLLQGVTTEVLGQDGIAPAPMRPGYVSQYRKLLAGLLGDPPLDWQWESLGDFLQALEDQEPSVNVCTYIPYGNLRLLAMKGQENREPTPEEMKRILALLDQGFREGGLGLSTGLVYPPCCYSTPREMVRVQEALAGRGFLVVHQRSEGAELLESMGELVEVARKGGAPLHLSHLKASGRLNWDKIEDLVSIIDQAREEGIEVTFDQYPYTAASTMMSGIIPPWAHEGGAEMLLQRLSDPSQRDKIRWDMENQTRGWENMAMNAGWEGIIVSSVASEENQELVGRSLREIGELRDQNPADAAMDLLLEEENAVGMVLFVMREEEVRTLMQHPAQMFCSDGIWGGKPHPRVYGSYPRVLGRYVRDQKVLRLEEAVAKMTSFPAQRLGLARRGLLKRGFYADVTVFDPEMVMDTATYDQPRQYPRGIRHVLVNGRVAVSQEEYTGVAAGRVIRNRGD